MAMPESTVLSPLSRSEIAGLASLWPKSARVLALEVAEATQVLSLRHLPGGVGELSAVLAAQALPLLPQPGWRSGIEPMLVWRSPSETLLLTQDAARAGALLAALRPRPGALACALDLSSATLVVKLKGGGVDALLSRLVDAHALPHDTGQASRVRLADIAALVWREAPDGAGLLVDRAHDRYLARWLSCAAEAIDAGGDAE